MAAPGFDGWAAGSTAAEGGGPARRRPAPPSSTLRSALVPAPSIDALDPTGCGDVFGAAAAARLFAGEPVEAALRHANGDGGAERRRSAVPAGSRSHLRGELVTP